MPKPTNQEITKKFLTDNNYLGRILYVKNWDLFYLYNDKYYQKMDSFKFRQELLGFLIKEYGDKFNITTGMLSDLILYIKLLSQNTIDEIATPYIAFEDKLLNIETFKYEAFNKKKIAIHYLPFKTTDLKKPTPIFNEMLSKTFVNKEDKKTDPELLKVLQECFGYYLLNDLKAQMVFFFVGSGHNGKSVICNLIKEMMGRDYITSMSIQTLTTNRFAPANLIGSKVNICSEEESSYIQVDKFKALISGDSIQVERKNETSFSFEPKTKYLFATNVMPNFKNLNYGLKKRINIIPFNHNFAGKGDDKDIFSKLKKELPGIIGWAIEGAKRFVGNNYELSKCHQLNEEIKVFEDNVSSAVSFFRESYTITEEKYEGTKGQEMYNEYRVWCGDTGRKPFSRNNFYSDLEKNAGLKDIRIFVGNEQLRVKNCIPLSVETGTGTKEIPF